MNDQQAARRRTLLRWVGVVVGMVVPTIVTLTYFVFGERVDAEAQQVRYAVMKGLQFAFPAVWTFLVLREQFSGKLFSTKGAVTGASFGATVLAAMLALYWLVLRDAPLFAGVADGVIEKLRGMGIDSTIKYAAVGIFYSLIHSALEEYYWRWFVFGQLRRLVPLWPAVIVSAIGFTAHHTIVLAAYFGWTSWLMWLLCLGITMGGVFWAWLYERSGSLLGPWLSHLLVDAGIFLVGYDLAANALTG